MIILEKQIRTIGCFGFLAYTLCGSAVGAQDQITSYTLEEYCASGAVECDISPAGLVVGPEGTTSQYAGRLDAAAETFHRYFGKKAPKAAVVIDRVLNSEFMIQLRKDHVVLPWLTQAGQDLMIKDGLRKQVKAQNPQLKGEALETLVQQLFAAHKNNQTSDRSAFHLGVLAHELGHLMFIKAFWPDDDFGQNTTNTVRTRYGGPAHDWLDEMAAVLLETDVLTQNRRQSAKAVLAEHGTDAFWPLEDYFTIVHPIFARLQGLIKKRAEASEEKEQGDFLVLTRDQIPIESGREPVNFYLQSRLFADYMIKQSGDEQIFAHIASYVSASGTIKEWLADYGNKKGIPGSVDDLQEDFNYWLSSGQFET